MTPRDKLAFLAAFILGCMGIEVTGGMVWLTLTGRDVPSALVGIASALVPALIGLLAMPPSNTRHDNGTSTRRPADPADAMPPRG